MSTFIQISEAKWFSQYKNGDDFLLNPSDTTNNIVGGIFENLRLEAKVIIYTTVPVTNFFLTPTSLHMPDGEFSKDIKVGDLCRVVFSADTAVNFVFSVTSASDTLILFNIVSGAPTFYGNRLSDDLIIVTTPLTFLRYNHGLKESTESDSFYRSRLDDETTSYFCDNIGLGIPRDTSSVVGEKLAINSNPGTFECAFIQNTMLPINNSGNFDSAQEFKLTHTIKVQDYSEVDIQNYIDGIKTDNYIGETTLDYNSEFEFRTIESSPDSAKIGAYESSGNIGFFGENLNGRINRYSISNLNMFRSSTLESVDDIISNEETTVEFTINSTENSFIQPPVLILDHFAMLTGDNYQFKDVDFEELFYNENLRIEGVGVKSGTIIPELEIISFTDSSINVRCKVNPASGLLDSEKYKLSILVGDISISNVVTDRVPLIIKAGDYKSGFDIEGLIGNPTLNLYQRNKDPYTDLGNSSFRIINGELIYTKFDLPMIGGTIESIDLETVTKKGGEIFLIDSVNIDTSSFVVVNGEQEIDEILPSPYSSGVDGKIEKVSTNNYRVVFPYVMPFNKLIKVDGLSDLLFDKNEPNNGFNENVLYQQNLGFTVHIAYKIGVLAEGIITYYRYSTPILEIKDFHENLN